MIWITEIIPKYLQIFISWPFAVSILGIIFLQKFTPELRVFIANVSKIKLWQFEATQQEVNITPTTVEKDVKENLREQGITLTQQEAQEIANTMKNLADEKTATESELKNKDELIKFLIERSELYEFAYLNYFLVQNSKLSLFWFQNSSTKENFVGNFLLAGQVANPTTEKEAILSVLLSNSLIEEEGILFKVSEKGKRFLKYIKFIN